MPAMALSIAPAGGGVLAGEDRARLEKHARAAVTRARARGEPVLAAVTVAAAPGTDPSAVAVASRRPGERWFCWEQPEREGTALAALGCVRSLESAGPDRFGAVAGAWRRLAASAVADTPGGPVAVGGFAFAPDGGLEPAWEGFPPAAL